ncbi:MAG: hypothetical protein ACJA01_001607 [Saprospiraceae bacterium]|jgi:hypothetical protein
MAVDLIRGIKIRPNLHLYISPTDFPKLNFNKKRPFLLQERPNN